MAACMRHRLALQAKKVLKLSTRASSGYYITLPEMPSDTRENNPILSNDVIPKLNEITPSKIIAGGAKLALQYEVELGKHIKKLEDPNYEKSFENVFEPIEKLQVPMFAAYDLAKALSLVNPNEFSRAFKRIGPQIQVAKNEKWVKEGLYNAVKEVKANSENLNEYQMRLVDIYLREAKASGVELSPDTRKKFLDLAHFLKNIQDSYSNNLMLSTNLFYHTIEDFGVVVDMPKHIVERMSVDKTNSCRGPWVVRFYDGTYEPFMEYCRDRACRHHLWEEYNQRASVIRNQVHLSNRENIRDIVLYSSKVANYIGYDTMVELSMELKMAESVDNVLNFIDSLKSKLKDKAMDEIEELQEYARTEGFGDKLEMWDLPYWRRRHREYLYRVNLEAIQEHFPFSHVINAIFELCSDLFGIKLTKVESESIEKWRPNVTLYRVSDSETGEELGHLILDPYGTEQGKVDVIWGAQCRGRSDITGQSPLSLLLLNLRPPSEDQPEALLSVDDLQKLSSQVGNALQQVLSRASFVELSGDENIELDAMHTVSMVLPRLVMSPYFLHSRISRHRTTGEPLPLPMALDLTNMMKHMRGFDMMQSLYFCALDLELFLNHKQDWSDTAERVWADFMQPMILHDEDDHPCSQPVIFSYRYPGTYYSYKWSEMMAADIFGAFDEVGLDNKEQMAVIGRRFRETFLSLGGSVHAREVFRRFRGRDPTPDLLVQEYGGSMGDSEEEDEH